MNKLHSFIRNRFPLNPEWVHFFVLLGSVFFFIVGSGEGYRTCAYLNVLFVVYGALQYYKAKIINWNRVVSVLWIPVAFMVLDLTAGNATGHRFNVYTKMVLILFLAYGWMMFLNNMDTLKQEFFLKSLLVLSCVFVVFQFFVYGFLGNEYVHSWHFGTFNNPHHLALYILLTAPLIFSFIFYYRGIKGLFLVVMLLISAWMLLKTSSRPAWLAILVGMSVLLPFLRNRTKLVAAVLTITLPVIFFCSSKQFHDRVQDLITNISTEERVEIWRNSWQMIQSSSFGEWVRGHGFDSFPTAYGVFTHFTGPQYTHPHNFVLEVLYTSGVLGLLLSALLYYFLTMKIVAASRLAISSHFTMIGKLVLVSATMLFFHLFLTLPFFSTYNFYVLVMVYLTTYYLENAPGLTHRG